jgi:hypothetical protein
MKIIKKKSLDGFKMTDEETEIMKKRLKKYPA